MSYGEVMCRRCNGRGEHEMSPAYAQTLRLITREWQTTTAINKLLPKIKQTALANRLAWLKDEGFVISRVNEDNARILEWRLK